MKFNTNQFIRDRFKQLKDNFTDFPIEIAVCLIAGIFIVWNFFGLDDTVAYAFSVSIPAILLFNRLADDKDFRLIYPIGSLVFICLSLIVPWKDWVGSNGKQIYFIIILVVLWSLFFYAGNEKNNREFAQKIYHFFVSLFLGMLYTGIVAGLFELIFYSCHLLFGISYGILSGDLRSYVWFFLVLPQFFLAQYGNRNLRTPWLHGAINMLLTPAVIIYTIILYIYFFKIIIQASFPAGTVSYMVLWYIGISILLQMNYYLVSKRNKLYDWFYEKLNYLCIFPLVMLFLAIYKRIAAYGFTEERFYLIAVGVFYACYIVLFAFRNTSKFKLLLPILILITMISTFTPYFNAYHFSIRSQENKIEKILTENDMLDDNGLLKPKEELTPISFDEFMSLRSALEYLGDRGIALLDLSAFVDVNDHEYSDYHSYCDLEDLIPYYMNESELEKTGTEKFYSFLSNYENDIYSISGFDSLMLIKQNNAICLNNYLFESSEDSLFVYREVDKSLMYSDSEEEFAAESENVWSNSLLFSFSVSEMIMQNMRKLKLDVYPLRELLDMLPDEKRQEFFTIDRNGFRFILSEFYYQVSPESNNLTVTNFSLKAILLKTDKK